MSNDNKYVVNEVSTKKKFSLLVGSLLCTYILPFILVAFKFDLFSKEVATTWKLTGIGLFLMIILAFKFSSHLGKFINDLKNKTLKQTLLVVRNVGIVIVVILLLETMREQILTLEILAIIICVSFTLGGILEEEYRHCLVQSEKYQQKREMQQAFKEYEESKKEAN